MAWGLYNPETKKLLNIQHKPIDQIPAGFQYIEFASLVKIDPVAFGQMIFNNDLYFLNTIMMEVNPAVKVLEAHKPEVIRKIQEWNATFDVAKRKKQQVEPSSSKKGQILK